LSRARAVVLGGLGIRLGFAPISDLRPHEDVLEGEVRSLAESMESEGVQSDPIMVDDTTLVVLDGAHRLAALRASGAPWASVALVDYRDPGIIVGRWLRSVDPAAAADSARRAGMEEVRLWRDAAAAVDSPGARTARTAVLLPSGPSYLGPGMKRCVDAHRFAREIWSRAHPISGPGLVADGYVEAALASAAAIVYPPTPSKDDVLEAAALGDLFPPKSTRHVFRVRPLGLDVPLEELMSPEPDVNYVAERARHLRVLPPGSNFRGRMYEERTVILGWGL